MISNPLSEIKIREKKLGKCHPKITVFKTQQSAAFTSFYLLSEYPSIRKHSGEWALNSTCWSKQAKHEHANDRANERTNEWAWSFVYMWWNVCVCARLCVYVRKSQHLWSPPRNVCTYALYFNAWKDDKWKSDDDDDTRFDGGAQREEKRIQMNERV